jgi:hypothetical protein
VRLPDSRDSRLLLAGVVAIVVLVVYLAVAFATTHPVAAGNSTLGNPVAPWTPHASTLVKLQRPKQAGFSVRVTPTAKGSYGALASTLVADPPQRKFVVGLWLRAARPGPVFVSIDEFSPDKTSVYLVSTAVPVTTRWRHFNFRGRIKGAWLGLGMYVSRQADRRLRSSFLLRGPTVAFLKR